ncbi:MAG: type II toxin-antitoxin system RelB/DinJ family antitoxin [Lachnospiraceae bacterium]|jgi:DNA-damage-inducible protein J|nr:type II toxin-antitoxin system RelB/DinJ family antitoxin [Lachnospiraceae bacterium]
MAQTTINVRMDEETKKKIEKIFEEMGMNISTAFNIFAKAVIQRNKIPFTITSDNFLYDADYKTYIEKALDDADNDTDEYDYEKVIQEMRVKMSNGK